MNGSCGARNRIPMSAHKPVSRLTSRAEQDIESIILHTERTWGEEQSIAYASAIARALDLLRDHPQFGRQREDLFSSCRSVQVEPHVIYYHQPQAAEVEVLRILHTRQDASTKVEDPHASEPGRVVGED
jgi:toxin ParE1/3/4